MKFIDIKTLTSLIGVSTACILSINAQFTTATVSFTDESGNPVISVRAPGGFIQVVDPEFNTDPLTKESVQVFIGGDSDVNAETIQLTETAEGSGVFRGPFLVSETDSVVNDGQVFAHRADHLTAGFLDSSGGTEEVESVEETIYYGVTPVSGQVDPPTTWTKAASPYLVTGDITVSSMATLRLEPGVEVLVEPTDDSHSGNNSQLVEFIIQGRLIAEGSVTDSIRFVSSANTPVPGAWSGFRTERTGNIELAFSVVQHANVAIASDINSMDGTGIVLTDSRLQDNLASIDIRNAADKQLVIEGNKVDRSGPLFLAGRMDNSNLTFTNNDIVETGYIVISTFKQATITDNQIIGTETRIQSLQKVVAENNHVVRSSFAIANVSRAVVRGNTITEANLAGIQIEDSNGLIDNNTVVSNANTIGITLQSSSAVVVDTLQNNTVTGNTGGGIFVSGFVKLVAHRNSVWDNGSYDISNTTIFDQDVRFNYWGPATTEFMQTGGNPKDISRFYDHWKKPEFGTLNYGGWLDSEGGAPSVSSATGDVAFVDGDGTPIPVVMDSEARIRLIDADRNTSPDEIETVSVRISSPTETNGESVLLTEDGPDTGVFDGTIDLDQVDAVEGDGVLAVGPKERLTVTYNDPSDGYGNVYEANRTVYYRINVLSGDVTEEVTLGKKESPILITGDVNITQGAQVTIDPGVEILFHALDDDQRSGADTTRIELIVFGKLVLNGSVTDTVRFKSDSDRPQAGDWGGLAAVSEGIISSRYASIEHPDRLLTVNTNPTAGPDTLLFTNSVLKSFNTGFNVYLDDYDAFVMSGCRIDGGKNQLLYMSGGGKASLSLADNVITTKGRTGGDELVHANIINNKIKGGSVGFNMIDTTSIYGNTLTGGGIVINNVKNGALIRRNIIEQSPMGGLQLQDVNALIDSNIVANNWNTAMYIYSSGNPMTDTLRHNTIRNNNGMGIVVMDDVRIVAHHNNIYGNYGFDYDVSNGVVRDQDARFNWWGEETTAEINEGSNPKNLLMINDRFDAGSGATVDYSTHRATEMTLGVPDLVSPPTATEGYPLTQRLTWKPADGFASYDVQVSKDDQFSSLASSNVVADTTIKVDGLELNTTYFWRVKGNPDATGWSDSWTFKTRGGWEGQAFATDIVVADAAGGTNTVRIGLAHDATGGYDDDYDQYAPPEPPAGSFDVRSRVSSIDLLHDIRPSGVEVTWWNLRFASSGGAVTLQWDPTDLPAEGFFRMRDNMGGQVFNIDMRKQNTLTISDPAIQQLNIAYHNAVTKNVALAAGWNMVGLPVALPDSSGANLFPRAIAGTLLGFDGTYVASDSVSVGRGYWIRVPEPDQMLVEAPAVTEVVWPLKYGWNMISGPSCSVPVSGIVDPNTAIVRNTTYGYSNGYILATTLEPGRGYWVMAKQDGTARYACPDRSIIARIQQPIAQLGEKSSKKSATDSFDSFVVTDREGATRTLFAGGMLPDGVDPIDFSLPPVPPRGVFDVRFANQRYVEDGLVPEHQVDLSGVAFPLTMALTQNLEGARRVWTVRQLDAAGQDVGLSVIDRGEPLVLTDVRVTTLMLTAQDAIDLPTEFFLDSPYPNPASGSANIKFGLPVDARVQVAVYNLLGQRVLSFIDAKREAGYHMEHLDTTLLPSSVYFIIMKADGFHTSRKMVVAH